VILTHQLQRVVWVSTIFKSATAPFFCFVRVSTFKKGLQEVLDENKSSYFAALNAVPSQPIVKCSAKTLEPAWFP
jgi:hypothetical protein